MCKLRCTKEWVGCYLLVILLVVLLVGVLFGLGVFRHGYDRVKELGRNHTCYDCPYAPPPPYNSSYGSLLRSSDRGPCPYLHALQGCNGPLLRSVPPPLPRPAPPRPPLPSHTASPTLPPSPPAARRPRRGGGGAAPAAARRGQAARGGGGGPRRRGRSRGRASVGGGAVHRAALLVPAPRALQGEVHEEGGVEGEAHGVGPAGRTRRGGPLAALAAAQAPGWDGRRPGSRLRARGSRGRRRRTRRPGRGGGPRRAPRSAAIETHPRSLACPLPPTGSFGPCQQAIPSSMMTPNRVIS